MVAESAQRTTNEKTHANRKKHMQIRKTSSSVWQHMCCNCSQHNQKQKRAENTHNTNK